MQVFDGHNDVLLHVFPYGRPGGRPFLTRSTEGHIDLPRAREGGLCGGLFAIFVRDPNAAPPQPVDLIRTPDGYETPLAPPIDPAYAAIAAGQVLTDLLRLEEEAQGAIRIVDSTADLATTQHSDALAVVIHLEGAEPIDAKLQNLEVFYRRGLRSLGITWSRPNAFGWGVPFKYPASPDTGPGLTPAGKDLVRACNQLGILIDLSHLNEKGFWDVADLSQAPLVASHSAAHALTPRTRNLTDRQLDAIGETGGLVGVTFAIYDLSPDGRLEGDLPLSALVRHIEYIAGRIGIDHVALGSDFDGATIPQEIGDVTGLPRLLEALRQAGFDEAALRKVAGENWLRILRDTWKD
jgi:membrane dipeptidase